jgi:uncharacterized membrane protein
MSLLRYTALRLLILVVVGGLLFASGARGFVLLALAFVLSGLASLVLLRNARNKVSADIVERVERRQTIAQRVNARIDAANRAEDEAVEGLEPEVDEPVDGDDHGAEPTAR